MRDVHGRWTPADGVSGEIEDASRQVIVVDGVVRDPGCRALDRGGGALRRDRWFASITRTTAGAVAMSAPRELGPVARYGGLLATSAAPPIA